MLWLILLTITLASFWLLGGLLTLPHDSREPPLVPQLVPSIGHAQGILYHGSRYYTRIFSKYPKVPIYTHQALFWKIYIVTSPMLASVIDRHSKSISFKPVIVLFARQILMPSQDALNVLSGGLEDGINGPSGLEEETLRVTHQSPMPGKGLEDITQALLESVSQRLGNMSLGQGQTRANVALFAWARGLVTRASTDAIFGTEKNPFQDPEDFVYLWLNILPRIVARHAYRARQRLFDAFYSYYASRGHEHASCLVKSRYDVNHKYGISQSDIAHFDLSISFGILVDTGPLAAWTLYYAFSSMETLTKPRQGIFSYVETTRDATTRRILAHHLNVALVMTNYPFLQSFIQEVLRVHSKNASTRVVLSDTMIDFEGASYLLKKDSILLIPSGELHADVDAWVPSLQPTFRINEVAIILVMMVCKFDLFSVAKDGWIMPECRPHITTSILSPVGDLAVEIMERRHADDGLWTFSWSR
ncbi:cytochrome P450 [Aspergillus stella-maris]|uniref:cytochrome P450 n=1 Tax=Aspergillus stella-maris TaxID=1810926 RepID=UPI003CCD7EA3